jgi:hypothetical protein
MEAGDHVPKEKAGRPRKWANSPPEPARVAMKPERLSGFPSNTDKSEFGFPPMHERAVAIGNTLINPWTPTGLVARLNGGTKRATQWIAAWLDIDWIELIGFNLYRRKEGFGQ